MERTIGIKVADGTFYPVLEEGFTGEKRLVLTTVRDNQAEVHVDLYQGSREAGIPGSRYIGSLIIENVRPVPKGTPDIEVVIGATSGGNLNVSATDKGTGEQQSLSVRLGAGDEEDNEIPDFSAEEPAPAPQPSRAAAEPRAERPAPAGEAWPEGKGERPRGRLALAIILAVIGIALVGAVAYLLYRTVSSHAEPAPAVEAPAAVVRNVAEPQKAAPQAQVSPAPQAAAQLRPAPVAEQKAAQPATPSEGEQGIRYRVKWGDTLWDLSSSYYRDPWLYPRIAKANAIPDPDLIVAGTTILIPER